MKTNKIRLFESGVAVLVLALSSSVLATPMLVEWQGGDTGDPFGVWQGFENPGVNPSVAPPTVIDGVDDDGTGDITGDAGGGASVGSQSALVVTEPQANVNVASDVFITASFGSNRALTDFAGLSFDFYADHVVPGELGFYFQSSSGGSSGTIWFYDITSSFVVDSWQTYNASFSLDSGWYGYLWDGTDYDTPFVDEEISFNLALADVDQLGFYITYTGADTGMDNVFGIDDFGLTVPEPETYVVLGMALLSVAFIFRKRITVSLAEARAMMQM